MRIKSIALALASFAALATTAAHAEKWDMPMAYSGSNFHSVTGAEFASCVTMFKGADIKRAIQTGQAPIGERLLSGHQNEDPVFGIDSIPFLATSFDDADKLWEAAKPTMPGLPN